MARSGASKGAFSAGSSFICANVLLSFANRRSVERQRPLNRWRPQNHEQSVHSDNLLLDQVLKVQRNSRQSDAK